jgi:Ion channel
MDQSLDPPPTTTPVLRSGGHAAEAGSGSAEASRRRRERYGLLLVALVAAFAVQGIASPGPAEEVLVSVLLAVALLLALRAAEAKPRVMHPAFAIAALVVIASIAQAAAGVVDGTAVRLSNLLLVALAPPAIVLGVMRSLRARNVVTVEAVFGVLCMYMLLGMAFGFVYGAIARIDGPFFANGVQASTAHCLYFSFTTLTTVGYGDLTAATNLGHTLSVSEALLGQIYMVTIVSLIVSNLGRARRGER